MPSQQLLKKEFWTLSVFLGISLGSWISLFFIMEMEKMKENDLVFRYWSGIYHASMFITALLAFSWAILLIIRLIVAFHDDYEDDDYEIKLGDTSDFEDDFMIQLGDTSDFEDDYEVVLGDTSDFD